MEGGYQPFGGNPSPHGGRVARDPFDRFAPPPPPVAQHIAPQQAAQQYAPPPIAAPQQPAAAPGGAQLQPGGQLGDDTQIL